MIDASDCNNETPQCHQEACRVTSKIVSGHVTLGGSRATLASDQPFRTLACPVTRHIPTAAPAVIALCYLLAEDLPIADCRR